jgi:16S rRNA (cytidine1402-2'-O)-methyltransferase
MKLSINTLYIVSTPIGNLDDITLRAVKVLNNSDIILCEDTRHSLKLLNNLKIKKKLISYHKFNEKKQTPIIIEYIKQGKILSLISDAGTPLLSDPGKMLINECIKNQIDIRPIPGVSSITASMSITGFKDQFLFYGFLPKTENELEKALKPLSNFPFSIIFFSPSLKLNFYLKKFKKFFSGRKILIAREISKKYETFYREDIDNIKMFETPLKGELTLVISGIKSKHFKQINFDNKKIINMIKKNLKKYSIKDTVELISKSEKISKKLIYNLCLKIKNEKII